MIAPFSIARLPKIEFGAGSFDKVPALAESLGRHLLLVTGRQAIEQTSQWQPFLDTLAQRSITWERVRVAGEPSPELVDETVAGLQGAGIEAVIGIGGGSVLDAAKAVAGLLPHGNSVMDHLEGVGPEQPYRGPALPFIAVPTTAGTGSEATKNAVLSRSGTDGFKKSFRDEQLVPQYAVVDPELLATCPPSLIAANGMDALTQLMESYVSLRANPLTDSLALGGIEAVRESLLPWYEGADDVGSARAGMAYGALISGVTLAQTGLGSVHGLASPLGAFFPIPHGVACGTLLAEATAVNLRALQEREPNNVALDKYAHLAAVLTGRAYGTREEAWQALVELLREWTARLELEPLSDYAVTADDLGHIVVHGRGSSMKTNPIVLTDRELQELLRQRI